MNSTSVRRPALAVLATAAALLLQACGNGSEAPAAQPAATVSISGRAVDGPLQGALACYDLNDNDACDAAEPSAAPTPADGSFTIAVEPAAAGRHAVVVEVPASAIDADTGAAVGRRFVLRAPASGSAGSQAVFVSPLTTLMRAHMAATGATLEQARTLVQAQAGIEFSPLIDFTLDTTAAARQTARVARLVQLTANEQTAALAAVLGTPDRSGTPVTEADVEREVLASLVAGLPLVAGTLADATLAAASGAPLQALLQTAARAIALQLDLSADSVRAAATLQRLAEPPAANPPVATAALRSLRYTDVNNWAMRSHQSSAADNVADANGYFRFYDWHLASSSNATTGTSVTSGGVVAPGSTSPTHWSGSAWVTRVNQGRYLSRVRDAQGRSDYNFGDGFEIGSGVRRLEDISGQSLLQVVRDKIRTFPGSISGVAFANWGPANLALYGSATFPAGSYLIYQSNTPSATAINYSALSSNQVLGYSSAVAAGGDSRVTAGLACANSAQNGVTTAVVTLESMVALFKGTPCIFARSGTNPNFSLTPDEWWGASSLNLGDLANTNTLPANTGSFYNTTATLRVSFAASGNRATFWRCYRRASDSSPRNCSVMGLGSWSIQTQGDGRVLSFSVAPALAQRLGYARHFVERGGAIYYASKSPVGTTTTDVRLNLAAANAVFHQLGLPRLKPVTEPGTATGARAASLATLQGVWGAASATSALVFRFGPDGRFFMAEAKPFLAQTREQSGAELGWFDHDPAGQYFSTLLEVDSNLTSGTSHPQPSEMFQPITITPSAITGGSGSNGFTIARLETAASNTSLVGLWGFNSATDLSAPQLIFFSNGRFMLVTHISDPQCAAAGQCPPGVEFSEYRYDSTTGALLLFNPLYDTNGCDGAFETCAAGSNNTTLSRTVTIAADGRSAVVAGGGQLQTIYRIAAR